MILASCGCHNKYHKLGGLRQHNVFFLIVLEDRSLKSSCHWQESWVQSLIQEDPLEKEWQATSVLPPGESHGQGILAGYSS